MLADAYVVSKLIFLMAVWGGAPEKYQKMLQVLLNDTARFVLDIRTRRDTTNQLMDRCGWMTVSEMVDYNTLILLWKTTRQNCPRVLASMMTLDETDSTIQTTRPRILHTTTAFTWRAAHTWNTLPDDIRNNMSLPNFKKTLKQWLISQRGLHLDPGDGTLY